MLIRSEQIQVFSEHAARNFEDQMVEHLLDFSPAHCQSLGDAVLRQIVRLGIGRAGNYGLASRGSARFYIELMIQLGTDFDSDPQLPWAMSTLNAPEPSPQEDRASLLYRRATNYLDAVLGPKYEYERQVLSRVERLTLEELSRFAEYDEERLLLAFNALHPQKMAYVGEASVRTIIREGVRQGHQRPEADPRFGVIAAALMFAFGHHCLTDPQFPWIQASLYGRAPRETGDRTDYLFRRTISYVKASLAILESP